MQSNRSQRSRSASPLPSIDVAAPWIVDVRERQKEGDENRGRDTGERKRGKKKSGTAGEGGTEKRDDWREGGAVSRGATRVRAWIIRSRVTRVKLSRRICIEGNGCLIESVACLLFEKRRGEREREREEGKKRKKEEKDKKKV